MGYNVNSSTFKKNKNFKKKNSWEPLVVIIVLALVLVALNWFLIDFTSGLYNDAATTIETTVEQESNQYYIKIEYIDNGLSQQENFILNIEFN